MMRVRLSDFTFTFHFPALEKEMATHSSVLAWRIPGIGEPSGLPSMGSHRVGHDWSDLAAAAAAQSKPKYFEPKSDNSHYLREFNSFSYSSSIISYVLTEALVYVSGSVLSAQRTTDRILASLWFTVLQRKQTHINFWLQTEEWGRNIQCSCRAGTRGFWPRLWDREAGQGKLAHGNSFRTKLIHPGERLCERKTNSKQIGHTTQKLQKHWQEGMWSRSLGSWAGALKRNEGWGYIFGSLQLTKGTWNWGCWWDHLGRRERSHHWALRQSSIEWPERRGGASKAHKGEGVQGMWPC